MRVLLQRAFILHQRPYRDSSLLLEAFTPDYGRVSLISKGGRSAKSDKRGLLQPFRHLIISWSGRGDLHTLTGIESAENSQPLKGNALYSGFYINELLMHLLHRHDPHSDLFEAYRRTIVSLSQNSFSESILRQFEKTALQEIGYGLQLEHDSSEAALIPEQMYVYQYDHGPTKVNHVPASANPVVSGKALLALRDDDFTDTAVLKELKLLMRAIMMHYLGDVVLRSRELFK